MINLHAINPRILANLPAKLTRKNPYGGHGGAPPLPVPVPVGSGECTRERLVRLGDLAEGQGRLVLGLLGFAGSVPIRLLPIFTDLYGLSWENILSQS